MLLGWKVEGTSLLEEKSMRKMKWSSGGLKDTFYIGVEVHSC